MICGYCRKKGESMKTIQTDEQTLDDLAIFGKSGGKSIYDLFNKTVTQGGARHLEEQFRNLLADPDEINRRSGAYAFFASMELSFPVDSVTMGTVAYYMQNDDIRSQLQVGGGGLAQRFQQMVAADAGYVFVEEGVQAVLRLFYRVQEFLSAMAPEVKGGAFETVYLALNKLAGDAAFSNLQPYLTGKEARLNDIILAEIDKQVRFTYRELVLELLKELYRLDVFIAVGQVARKSNFHFAVAKDKAESELNFRQLYHPSVENAIANDLSFSKDNCVLFLTGANMAGKSTLMKSIGVALYLAHMGFPVAAEAMEFSVVDGIYTSINLADNLNAGASHYYAEVLRVKQVAWALNQGKSLFVIFDEMFRGTNVKDAYDATITITRAFSNKTNSRFIISTHIMEAGEILQKEPLGILYQYLPTEMDGTRPVYTRVLSEGITADRQGMIIIENEGILEMLDKGRY